MFVHTTKACFHECVQIFYVVLTRSRSASSFSCELNAAVCRQNRNTFWYLSLSFDYLITEQWNNPYYIFRMEYAASFDEYSYSLEDAILLERRWSSRTFRYGYLVTTSPQSSAPPSAAPSHLTKHDWLRVVHVYRLGTPKLSVLSFTLHLFI